MNMTELLTFRKILLVLFFREQKSFFYLRPATEDGHKGKGSHIEGLWVSGNLIYLACAFQNYQVF